MTRKCFLLSITLFSLFLSKTYGTTVNATAIQKALGSANSTGVKVHQQWTGQQKLNSNLIKPIMTGQSPLATLDKSSTATIQITCPGTEKLFQIMIQPDNTNDLKLIQIMYDTNMDGTLDKTVNINGPVSGICVDGIISCNKGTWDNCTWYKWQYSGSVLSLQNVGQSGLSGCYCINSYCAPGLDFTSTQPQILQSLGTGVATAMAAANVNLSTSKAKIDGPVITYYGQNTGNCGVSNSMASYGLSNPQNLYQNQAQLANLAQQEVTNQETDPGSFYHLLSHSPANTGKIAGKHSCTMRRTAVFDSTQCNAVESVDNGCSGYENNANCTLLDEKVYDVNNNLVAQTVVRGTPQQVNPLPTCKHFSDDDLGSADINSCIQAGKVATDNNQPFQYSCSQVASLGNGLWECKLDPTSSSAGTDCTLEFQYNVCGYFKLTWNIPDDPCEHVQIGTNVIRDYCPNKSNDTIPDSGSHEGNTGSICQALTASFQNIDLCNGMPSADLRVHIKPAIPDDICRDWWKIERTYLCKSSNSTQPDVSRIEALAPTITEGDDEYNFTDTVSGQGSLTLPEQQDDNCTKACKVKKIDNTAEVAPTALSSQVRTNHSSTIFLYRTCFDGSCPYDPNTEVIVKDCTCLSTFNEALGAIKALDNAASGMQCVNTTNIGGGG